MALRPHHIGIVVDDLQEALRFYTTDLDCRQVTDTFVIDRPDYGVKYAFVGAKNEGGMLIELLEPMRGDLKEQLREKGPGAICELCFVVDDIESFYDQMKQKGVIMEDRNGRPLTTRKYDKMEATGNKAAYLPREAAQGTWVEILEQSGTKY